jgi:hypothetical protein
MSKLCFDFDPLLYTCCAIAETRSVKVVHRESGDEYDFANRTAFYGHWKKKAGGWLAEYNAGRKTPRLADEFDYTDIQTPEPIGVAINKFKSDVQAICEAVGTNTYYGYSGKGTSFREDVSTVIQYKGNRLGAIRPVLLDDMKDYIVKHQACKIVTGIEADDACSIDQYTAWKKWDKSRSDKDKLILAYIDKDYLQCAGHLFHIDAKGDVDSYDGFGKLYLNAKGDVKGRGRMWLYFQVLSGDSADNYFANSATEMKWGDKTAYGLLVDCKNDMEAFDALVTGYKTLYPSPKKIIGWRGDTIEIDWLYMLGENFQMARMLRWKEDKVIVKDVLDNLKIEY